MKPGVFLVNTSRGPVVEEVALVEALKSGKVWGAGLDVMEIEPLPADSELRKLENVTLTPHVGANSEQSVEDLYQTGIDIAVAVCNGRWPIGVVNPQVEGKTRFAYAK
jgi:phosphoglycerate dehydrogenase-like enzyme